MSSGSKKNRKKWDYGYPPGHRGDRTVSSVSEVSMTSTLHATLSPEARETIFKLKKIPDPFSEDMQSIFDDFITHVEESSFENVNLSESSLLLSGVTKIYSAQVINLQKSIKELAEFVTKTEKKTKEKKDTEGDKNDLNNTGGQLVNEDGLPIDANGNKTPSPSEVTEIIQEDGVGQDNSNLENSSENPDLMDVPCEGFADGGCNPVADNVCDTLVVSNPGEGDKDGEGNASETVVVPDENKIGEEEVTFIEEVVYGPLTESAMKANVIIDDGPTTRKRLMCFKDLLNSKDEPLKKKERCDISQPPTLIAYYEEMNITDNPCFYYAGDENPPELNLPPPPPEKRKRNVRIEVLDKESKAENESQKLEEKTEDIALVEIKIEPEDIPDTKSEEESQPINNTQPLTIPVIPDFAPEDQSSILECINELHYLPFTFELSNSDLAMAFSKTVDRICSIFQKYNVPLSRAMIKAASAMCSGIVPKGGNPTNGVHATLHKLNGIQDTFLKNFGAPPKFSPENSSQETPVAVGEESTVSNSAATPDSAETPKKSQKTIFELTPEKTVAQSRETMRAMLEEMQRTIVPKYARIPMMEENTPEFFQRVTNFEKKMRKVLDAEATKEEFDVRKYEMEVLEVTTKEQGEDEIQVPLSPIINTVLDQPSDDESNNDLDLNFQGCSSSRSSFEGSRTSSNCGSRWVPLSHIFRHMKKLEKVEACRLFYAVLALLSYQNLDINYDHLYSEESARLTDKSFDHEQNGKYPRGVKIMTSRCPDVDKEEVYVAALTSISRTEEFRQFMVEESRKLLSNNGNGATSPVVNGDAHYGVQEAKNSFVEEELCTNYVGQLFGKRGRRPLKAAPIPFIPFPLRQ